MGIPRPGGDFVAAGKKTNQFFEKEIAKNNCLKHHKGLGCSTNLKNLRKKLS
jgi:hypothetical protein